MQSMNKFSMNKFTKAMHNLKECSLLNITIFWLTVVDRDHLYRSSDNFLSVLTLVYAVVSAHLSLSQTTETEHMVKKWNLDSNIDGWI